MGSDTFFNPWGPPGFDFNATPLNAGCTSQNWPLSSMYVPGTGSASGSHWNNSQYWEHPGPGVGDSFSSYAVRDYQFTERNPTATPDAYSQLYGSVTFIEPATPRTGPTQHRPRRKPESHPMHRQQMSPSPPRWRRNAVQYACKSCTKRKVKCDRQKPTCGACQEGFVRVCIYTDKDSLGDSDPRFRALEVSWVSDTLKGNCLSCSKLTPRQKDFVS